MNRLGYRSGMRWLALQIAIAIVAMPIVTLAQTKITYHSNKFSPADDVKLGRQAAAEAEQQFPLLRDAQVNAYVERVGQRLVAAIPPEFQHPEFRFYFKVINASDINAFALPGGPMYVNRGMIQAARTEGEMAGVMAHELSHVALRHGTAQATKAQKYAIGAGVAGILGTILAGPAAGQLAQLPIGAYFLKYSREYETEADLLGARIMANAGYDPRDLANMFRTIEAQGGGGGGFLSDHPSPKDRQKRILIRVVFIRWTDRNHVEQLTVPQLRRRHVNDFRLTRSFIGVVQSEQLTIAPINVQALIVAARAQISVALLQAVDEVIRGLLQISIACLHGADIHRVSVDRLSISG